MTLQAYSSLVTFSSYTVDHIRWNFLLIKTQENYDFGSCYFNTCKSLIVPSSLVMWQSDYHGHRDEGELQSLVLEFGGMSEELMRGMEWTNSELYAALDLLSSNLLTLRQFLASLVSFQNFEKVLQIASSSLLLCKFFFISLNFLRAWSSKVVNIYCAVVHPSSSRLQGFLNPFSLCNFCILCSIFKLPSRERPVITNFAQRLLC